MLRLLVIFLLVASILPTSVSFAQDTICDPDADYYTVAVEASFAEDWQGVVDAGNCIIQLDATDPYGYYYRALGFYYLDQESLAVNDLTYVLELGIDDGFLVEIYYYLGASYYYMSEDELALQYFALMLAQNPEDPSYAQDALNYYTQAELNAAVAALSPTPTPDPVQLECDEEVDLYELGLVALDEGEFEIAVEAFTCLLQHDFESATDLAEVYRLRGESYQLLGDDENAIVDLDEAIRLYDGDWYAYLLRGVSHLYQDDTPTAITDFANALDLDPENDFIWYYIGLAHHYMEADQDAIEAFDAAIEFNADNSLAYAFRAQSYFILEDDEKALEDIAQAIELGEEPLAYLIWGQILYYQGELEAALEPLNTAIELGADNPDILADAYNYRGQVYYYLEQDNLALPDFSQAVSYGDEAEDTAMLGEAYSYRGQSKFAIGDYESAAQDFTHATEYETEDPLNYFFLGETYTQMGDLDAAQFFFAYSAHIDEDFTEFITEYSPGFDLEIIEIYAGDFEEDLENYLPDIHEDEDEGEFPDEDGEGDGEEDGELPDEEEDGEGEGEGEFPDEGEGEGDGELPDEDGDGELPEEGEGEGELPEEEPSGFNGRTIFAKPTSQLGGRALLFIRQTSDRTVVRSRTTSADRVSNFGSGRRSGARRSSGSGGSSFNADFSIVAV